MKLMQYITIFRQKPEKVVYETFAEFRERDWADANGGGIHEQ